LHEKQGNGTQLLVLLSSLGLSYNQLPVSIGINLNITFIVSPEEA
jgi:hypothetical protein